MGSAYNISAKYVGIGGVGEITINGKILSSKIDDAVKAIFEEMQSCKDNIDELELAVVKEQLEFSLLKMSEVNELQIELITTEWDDGVVFADAVKKFDSLTPADIRIAAQKYLPSSIDDGSYVMLIRDPLKSQD